MSESSSEEFFTRKKDKPKRDKSAVEPHKEFGSKVHEFIVKNKKVIATLVIIVIIILVYMYASKHNITWAVLMSKFKSDTKPEMTSDSREPPKISDERQPPQEQENPPELVPLDKPSSDHKKPVKLKNSEIVEEFEKAEEEHSESEQSENYYEE